MKAYLALFIGFLLVVFSVGCSSFFEDADSAKLMDNGFIVDIDQSGQRILVTEEWAGNEGQQPMAAWLKIEEGTSIVDLNQKNIPFAQLRPGLNVEVWSKGAVAESYPVQAEAAKVVINDDGDLTLAVSKALSHLQESGLKFIQQVSYDQEKKVWSIKVIELGKTHELIVNLQTGEAMEQAKTPQPTPEPEKQPDTEQPKPAEDPPAPSQPDITAENEAFRIFAPAPGTVVGKKLVVRGEARVFEAVLSYSLEDGHNILAEGHVMASKGAPEWGSFEIEITVDQVTSPSGTLIIYEASAKDGSPIHVLNIPVSFQKDLIKR